MPTMVKTKCSFCEKVFEKELKKYNEYQKQGWNHFCSSECRSNSKKTGAFYECAACGKSIWKTPSQVARSKTGNVYCSKSCSATINNTIFKSGSDNPNYTNGAASYWDRAFNNQNHVCVICGYDEDSRLLEVHHIDSNRQNNDISNLVILCPMCHRKITLGISTLDSLIKTSH